MASPWLLFDNLYANSGATITASSEASGYPDDNVKDWRTYTRWRAANTNDGPDVEVDVGAGGDAANTLVIGGHNLVDIGAEIMLRRGATSPPTTDVFGANEVVTTDPFLVTFSNPGNTRYWSLFIFKTGGGSFSSAPEIGVITLGLRLAIPRLTPSVDIYGEEPVRDDAVNRAGHVLGIDLARTGKRFNMSYLTAGFTEAEFYAPGGSAIDFDNDFKPHARSNPFWFAWNTDEQAQGCYLCRSVGSLSNPFIGSTNRRGFSMQWETVE